MKKWKNFNGVSDDNEEQLLLQKQLENLEKQNKQLKNQLEIIKKDFDKEKQGFEDKVKKLKGELHRTNPIQENKFFSFSKELREAVKAIESISDISVPSKGTEVVTSLDSDAVPKPANSRTFTTLKDTAEQQKPQAKQPQKILDAEPPPEEAKPAETQEKKAKSKGKDKKLLATGVVLLVLLMVGGILSFTFSANAEVNQDLVDEYLNNGQVQGAQTGELSRASQDNKGIIPDKNADLPFEDTQWELLEDRTLGLRVKYPGYLTQRLHSATGATFMRKESYLFKFQYVESDQSIEEYLQGNPKLTENYASQSAEINGKKGVQLTPLLELEYPAEKYFIKAVDRIYEFTFALPSDKFSEDDFKRVDHIKESIDFMI